MNLRPLATLVAAVAVGFAAACGGSEPAPVTPPPPPSTAPVDTTPPVATTPPVSSTAPVASTPPAEPPAPTQPGPGEWDKWSHEQKLAWMKVGVMPKAKQMFQDYDSAKYADVKCGLCHGAGAKDGSFKMPNPDLPKLPASMAGFKPWLAKHPKMGDFMMKQVSPTTASLLGQQPFDPKTGQGFGCHDCHTTSAK
jgi:cytochrome c553